MPFTMLAFRHRPRTLALAASLLGAGGLFVLAGCNDNSGGHLFQAPITSAGDTYAVTSQGRLISFNRANPTNVRTSVGLGTSASTIVGGDLRPNGGQLYVLARAASGAGTLYVIDPVSGGVTYSVALTADPTDATSPYTTLMGSRFGVDFNPVVDRLRVVSDSGQNLRINVSTGTVITDTNITPASVQPVAAAYTDSLNDACATMLLVLNANDGNLYPVSPANAGTAGTAKPTGLGAFASTDRVTFDIHTSPARADEGVVVKNTTVYELNTATGTATSQGALNLPTGEVVIALFVTGPLAGTSESGPNAAQQGDTMAVLGSNVATFNAATPQKLCSSTAISGLGSGETVLDTDFRPSTSTIYALTSQSRLVTLDPFGGTATVGKSLTTTDASGTTSAYTLKAGDSYGIDFNPTVDLLRVVSSSGLNLRVNADTGATTVDTPLNTSGRTPVVTDAAYTNSAPLANGTATPYAAPGTTTLYDIDTGNNSLYQQNPPNSGTLTLVGALGVSGSAMNGFDIVSTRSAVDASSQVNTAYAALTVGGVAGLYTVNTTSGAATLVNRIGDGTATIYGLTRAK